MRNDDICLKGNLLPDIRQVRAVAGILRGVVVECPEAIARRVRRTKDGELCAWPGWRSQTYSGRLVVEVCD